MTGPAAFHDLVLEALEALRIETTSVYRWFGRRFVVDPKGGLRGAVGRRLYTDFYCRGGATPHAGPDEEIRSARTHGFVDRLSRANAGRGAWDPAWRVVGHDDGFVVVERDGLRVWALPSEVRTAAEGVEVAVRRGAERRHMAPGFYLALGDAPEPLSHDLVRFYFNVTSEGAPPLVAAATRRLNAGGIPFRLKVLDDPRAFTRCDAAVLYAAGRHRATVEEHARTLVGELEGLLLSRVPALALALAPGLGFAEDPGGDESFGMSRCRLIADAVVRGHERAEDSLSRRLELVAERFSEAGLDLRRPFVRSTAAADPPRQPAVPA